MKSSSDLGNITDTTEEETSFKADAEWFRKSLREERKISLSVSQSTLAEILIQKATQSATETEIPLGVAIAAAFDLFVAAEYYTRTANNGWLYCPSHGEPLLIYPFTNACTRCVLHGEFHFHKANKPESGTIGAATRTLLCGFLKELFKNYSRNLEIYVGYEPVDVIVFDAANEIALLAEIKAAPLTTLPLAVSSEAQFITDEDGKVISRPHSDAENSSMSSSEFNLLLPKIENDVWTYELVPLGIKGEGKSTGWFYDRLATVLNDGGNLFERYFEFWRKAYGAYDKSKREKGVPHTNVYWMTNACGTPTPIPSNWRMKKTGYESISDGKSSVGMDRTDDIKKGTYQVLKIATSGKPRRRAIQNKNCSNFKYSCSASLRRISA